MSVLTYWVIKQDDAGCYNKRYKKKKEALAFWNAIDSPIQVCEFSGTKSKRERMEGGYSIIWDYPEKHNIEYSGGTFGLICVLADDELYGE